MPVRVTYQSASEVTGQNLMVTITLQRLQSYEHRAARLSPASSRPRRCLMRMFAGNIAFLLALSGSALAQQAAQPAQTYTPPTPEAAAELPVQQPQQQEQVSQPADEQETQGQGQPAYSKYGEAMPGQAAQRQPRQAPNVPIIGARRLMQSLSELDRPLTPEEITAYGATVQSLMPMSPEIIRDYRRRVDESQKAAAMPPSGFRARPISDSVRMSLKSNQALQTLYTTPNTVSVMAFYDRTGKAWPIASFVVGRADSFQVYALQEGSNQIAVTPLVTHGYSNLIISLVEEDRPIVINLETSDTKTHFRRDITVEGTAQMPRSRRRKFPLKNRLPTGR